MADWNIGAHDVSEETQAFRDRLASKDTHIAAQQTQLLRQTADLEEIRASLNDALHKLTTESERAMRLEKELFKCNDDLRIEKTAVHNSALALDTAHRQLKEKDLEHRELLSHLDTLSHQAADHKSRTAVADKEKSTLTNRIRELEASLKESGSPAASAPCRIPRAVSRPRSSSLSNMRITTLEIELEDVRAQLAAKDLELRDVTQKLGLDVMRAENEKGAAERTMQKRVAELEAELEVKEDELEYLRSEGEGGGGGEREAELMQRIDEDEAKIHALEMLLGDAEDINAVRNALKKAEHHLHIEQQKLAECTSRQVELVQDKEEALDELEDSRDRIASLERSVEDCETLISALKRNVTDLRASQPSSPESPRYAAPNQQTVEDIERLLSAVNRLRHERDELRRQFKFLEMEHKFNLEELEKLRSLPPPATTPPSATTPLRSEYADDYGYFDLTVTALGLVIGNLASEVDESASLGDHDASSQVAELEQLRLRAEANAQCLQEAISERDELQTRLKVKETEWLKEVAELKEAHEESKDTLNQLDAQLGDITSALEDTEAQRDSLSLQVENLSTDLITAQNELQDAESRYSSLQFHQLSNMSSSEATRALSEQLEELERRVLRRTEQIGIQQHDIKRMETNLRLQEERITELTAELDTMVAEKNAMVEDCADAREARDDAVSRCETLEMETETLRENAVALETLIQVVFDVTAKSRSAIRRLASEALDAKAYAQHLGDERSEDMRSVDEMSVALRETQDKLDVSTAEVQQATAALASSQMEVSKLLSSSESTDKTRVHLEERISELQDELAKSHSDRTHIADQLEDLQRESKALESTWGARTAELENAIASKEEALAALETSHRDALKDALSQLSEKEKHLANSSVEQEQLVQLKMKHVEEMGDLQSRVIEATSVLEETQMRFDACEAERVASIKELGQAQAELARLAATNEEGLARCTRLSEELRQAQQNWDEEKAQLSHTLEGLKTDLGRAESARDSLDALHQARIAESQDDNRAQLRQLQEEIEGLNAQLDEQSNRLSEAVAERDALHASLEEESSARASDSVEHARELDQFEERCHELEVLNAELSRDVDDAHVELNKAQEQVDVLHGELMEVQQENTKLRADVQRQLSLTRYLQSQVQDMEAQFESEHSNHEQCRAQLARAEKAASAAEVKLSMLTSHHKTEVSQIQRELSALRAKPSLDHVIAELEERNNEMEELLRAKCTEIEENDDKTLELLKENKKLGSKVEALTRKVQNLQTKLVAAKASATTVKATSSSEQAVQPTPTPPLVQAPAPNSSRGVSPAPSLSSFPRSRSGTLTSPAESTFSIPTTSSGRTLHNAPSSRALPSLQPSSSTSRISPPAPQPMASASRPRSATLSSTATPTPAPAPPTPNSRLAGSRVASTPSSLPRPKTPERKRAGIRAGSPIKDVPPSAAGKKRAAPDDFSDVPIPAQAFTVDSLPDNGDGTPRMQQHQRPMHGMHTGFTPMRHKREERGDRDRDRERSGSGSGSTPLFMNDLTNNLNPPGGEGGAEDKAPLKSSWLGKIRGGKVRGQGMGATPHVRY